MINLGNVYNMEKWYFETKYFSLEHMGILIVCRFENHAIRFKGLHYSMLQYVTL